VQLTWTNAEKLLASLDSPYGDSDSWGIWFEEAWGHLANAGLTTVSTPLDFVLVRLRLMALRWLTLDFGFAVERDHWNHRPDWKSWAKAIEMSPGAASWAIASDPLSLVVIAESHACQTDFIEDEDGEVLMDEDEVVEDVNLRLMALAVFRQRDAVVDALHAGFDDLFASLYANCTATFDVIWDRRSELAEKLGYLEAEIAKCQDDADLQLAIQETHAELETKCLQKYAMNYLRVRALGESGTGSRWCSDGCPVVSFGTPSVSVHVD